MMRLKLNGRKGEKRMEYIQTIFHIIFHAAFYCMPGVLLGIWLAKRTK